MKSGQRAAGSLLLTLALFEGASGCSLTSRPPAAAPTTVLKAGRAYVDLAAVEAVLPETPLIRGIDQGLKRSETLMAAHARRGVQVQSTALAAIPPPSAAGFDQDKFAREQEEDLAGSVEATLNNLDTRLGEADDNRLAALATQQRDIYDQKFTAGRDSIVRRTSGALSNLSVNDPGQLTNLRIQIDALKVNDAPPRTAPDDHWGKLIAERQALLDSALEGQRKLVATLLQSRDAQIEDLRSTVDGNYNVSIESSRLRLAQARIAVIESAREQFVVEQNGLMRDNRALLASVVSSTTVDSDDTAVATNSDLAAQAAQQQSAAIENDIKTLSVRRALLTAQARVQAWQISKETARENNCILVDGQGMEHAVDLTATVVDRILGRAGNERTTAERPVSVIGHITRAALVQPV